MAELTFFTGTMDCGKSTLALQMDYNHTQAGQRGIVLTQHDRSGKAMVSSRLGLQRDAIEVTDGLDLFDLAIQAVTTLGGLDYVIADEVQFYAPRQIDQLARVVDELDADVFAFGITADFQARLFPGSQRLLELADRTQLLQVAALCWCGRRATHNARVIDGTMVVEGEQVVVGDTDSGEGAGTVVEYEVLCRRHFMRRMTRRAAHAYAGEQLPFNLDLCPLPGLPTDLDIRRGGPQGNRGDGR